MRTGYPWKAWLTILMCSATAQAHHSFSATYVPDQQISIEGQVVQLLFRNPHSFIHVVAPDTQGQMQRWAIEWASAAVLKGNNISVDTLAIGDKVIATGNPGRNVADHRILLRSIVRPSDGWKWIGTFQ